MTGKWGGLNGECGNAEIIKKRAFPTRMTSSAHPLLSLSSTPHRLPFLFFFCWWSKMMLQENINKKEMKTKPNKQRTHLREKQNTRVRKRNHVDTGSVSNPATINENKKSKQTKRDDRNKKPPIRFFACSALSFFWIWNDVVLVLWRDLQHSNETDSPSSPSHYVWFPSPNISAIHLYLSLSSQSISIYVCFVCIPNTKKKSPFEKLLPSFFLRKNGVTKQEHLSRVY